MWSEALCKNTMKTFSLIIAFAASVLFVACAAEDRESDSAANVTHANAAEAAKLIAEKKVVVIDVRTSSEFSRGHIEGAKLISISSADFKEKLDQLDKNQTYLVHCASGVRSTRALKTFNSLGFKSIVHLDGGMDAWIKAGQPVQK